MAGTCLIPVTDNYLAGLIIVMSDCHSTNAEAYYTKKYTGKSCCSSCDSSLESLVCLGDMIFYLQNVDLTVDDCSSIHKIKESAMSMCPFSEKDVEDASIINAILMESGDYILTESGLEYLELE